MAIRDKTTTNKWTYERSHKSLNSYSLGEYNKIYHNTNSWKILQEKSLWQVDFNNLYFWNTLNKTHHGILVWNRNNRFHTIYKRKQAQYMTINGHKTSCTRINVSNKERKEKIHNILTTSLKKKSTLPVIPQFDWLCDVCGCVMSPTSDIY